MTTARPPRRIRPSRDDSWSVTDHESSLDARRRRFGSVRTAVAASALATVTAALALTHASPGTGQTGGLPAPRPQIGLPAGEIVPFGATADGETWGYGTQSTGTSLAGDTRLTPGLVLVRRPAGGEWQGVQNALDADGHAIDGFTALPGPGAGRMTAHGAGVLLGTGAAANAPVQVLTRDPGGTFRTIPAPEAADDTHPDAPLHADERLATRSDALVAALDEPGDHAGVLIAPVDTTTDAIVEDGVLHYDGSTWTREPIDLDAADTTTLDIVALDAASPQDAWLVGKPAASTGKPFVLFHREADGAGGWVWKPRSLTDGHFATAADAPAGISGISPAVAPAQGVTATTDGVWVDALVRASGGRFDLTLFVRRDGPNREEASWCDATDRNGQPLCDHPFAGAALSTDRGYRSFAWAGDGAGTRVITNALRRGQGEDSSLGSYLALDGTTFVRRPGGGGATVVPPGGAFSSAAEGWLGGTTDLVQITAQAGATEVLPAWPVAARRPLTAIAAEPGTAPGAVGAKALAVGAGGTIARYVPGSGWLPEFLLNGSGSRVTPRLRGVAWPEPSRAYAVGDRGEMWLWRAATGLWERDEAAPEELVTNLMSIAFAPGNPQRGYVVGQDGTLLRYDKSWIQEPLPEGMAGADLTSVAFAGNQALVAAGNALLTNDGGGWVVDQQATDLIRGAQGRVFAVAGLPDGGAVAAGDGVVLERDGAGGPWRLSDQPLLGAVPFAVAAVRDGGRVRALVSATTSTDYPEPIVLPPTSPDEPPILKAPFPLPQDGWLLRETVGGWQDVERGHWRRSGPDAAAQPDALLAFLVDADGHGWAVGGVTGADRSGLAEQRTQTAGIVRLGGDGGLGGHGDSASDIALTPGVVRFAVGGNAVCRQACSDLADQRLGPDVGLASALTRAAALAAQPSGPRAFLYTGGRVDPGGRRGSTDDAARYAQVAASTPIPFYPTLSGGDSEDGALDGFRSAFAPFPAPLGTGPSPRGFESGSLPGAPGDHRARTHYAFDSFGSDGAVRVIVIDNGAGSLAAADPHQSPQEDQLPWLRSVLQDAKAQGVPAIVVGSRDLNSALPAGNTADDADAVARVLVDEGASAYLNDRPYENRRTTIPAGAADGIPEISTGTLGYGDPTQQNDVYGAAGFVLLEIDSRHRDPTTNRAPVGARLIPVLDQLAIDPVDGALPRRSRAVLFSGLGRRPAAGELRPTYTAGEGASPYVDVPAILCPNNGCPDRIAPEYTFSSSEPDIGDFVAHDPSSADPRDVLLGPGDKPVPDPSWACSAPSTPEPRPSRCAPAACRPRCP